MSEQLRATERPRSMSFPLPEAVSVVTTNRNADVIEITELTVREPTAGEWLQSMQRSGFESTLDIIAKAAGLEINSIKKLPISVVTEAGEFIYGFLRTSPGTGAAS